MNVKKLLAILCVLSALLCLAGCKENTPTEPEQTQPSTQPSGTEATVPDAVQPTETEGETAGPTTQPSNQPTTQPSAEPTTAPSAEPTTMPSTDPSTEPTTESVIGPGTSGEEKPKLVVEYETYNAMSGDEQKAFMESFDGGVPAFVVWYNSAKEAYEKYYPDVEIGADGSINLGGLTGGNP